MGFFDFVSDIIGPVTDIVGGIFGAESADDASDAARDAAATQANAQLEALNYLKEIEKLPQELRGEALTRLAGVYGLPGGDGDQSELIKRARQSPLYSALMSGQKAGEEGILRSASATGGLRSGSVQGALYDYNVDLQNKSLLEAYNQQLAGLAGLAQLPSNANQIADSMAGIGKTQAQGITAAAQIGQEGNQNFFNSALPGIAGLINAVI